MRLLGAQLLLLCLTAVGVLLVQREVLLDRLDDEVEQGLQGDVDELQQVAARLRGAPTAEVLEEFLRRHVPGEGEAVLAFAGGELRGSTPAPHRLEQDGALAARWASLRRAERGELDTPAGPVRWRAEPRPDGVLVTAAFLQGERDEVDDVTRVGALVAGSVVLLATALGWVLAGRLVRPLRVATDTARRITESALDARVPVRGRDEIAEMSRTVNLMLDRLQAALGVQRAFVHDASHELRTPITVVRGHLELMTPGPPDQRETLALVDDELDRMSRIVDDLFLLASSPHPDFLRPVPVELAAFTRGLLAKASATADRRWGLDQVGQARLVADPQRLTSAVLNLVANAVQHTSPGDLVALGSCVHGREVRLWVRDEGEGVAAEDQARIFDRFARAGARRSGGAGLGLSIVRAVAEAHGGRVEVVSRLGEGSTFALCVPLREGVPQTAPDEGSAGWDGS